MKRPEPIPATIEHHVRRFGGGKEWAKNWGLAHGVMEALFLCRVLVVDGIERDVEPVAVFRRDSDAHLYQRALKGEPLTENDYP